MNKAAMSAELLENLTEEQIYSVLESVEGMQLHESAGEGESEIGHDP